MGLCMSFARNVLDVDKILENINRFFAGLIIRKLGIDEILDKVKGQVMSGQVANVEAWKALLDQEIYNSEYGQTSKAVVVEAMNDAQTNYGDQTLPLLCLLFFADSSKETFVNAFKAVNLARTAQNTGAQIQNVVQNVQSGGLLAGLASGFGAARSMANTAQQVQNPSMVKRTDLKNLCAYYTNFITLLPVNILARYNEGSKIQGYFTRVLNNAFNKNVQNRYVENTLFSKYNNQEMINCEEFFNDHYATMRDDSGFRRGLVNDYVKGLSPSDIRNIISGD